VRTDSPVALDPPLRGGPWLAIYDPAAVSGHRRALFAIDGRARIPARFAIDWIKQGADSGGYGEDVLAAGDAVVSAAVDRFPEPTIPITLDNSAGNYITLDFGGGRFVFYEYLKPGSIRVKRGDRVHGGDVIALLGKSGSVSSGAHLHFHVADVNASLGAEGVPFVFKTFDTVNGSSVAHHRQEMPLEQAAVRF
jgi:murein DD-endopeptidase MepM/ murein hydrolase activator NlpD